MNRRSSFLSSALGLFLALALFLPGSALLAGAQGFSGLQLPQEHFLSFKSDFAPTTNGLIVYKIHAVVTHRTLPKPLVTVLTSNPSPAPQDSALTNEFFAEDAHSELNGMDGIFTSIYPKRGYPFWDIMSYHGSGSKAIFSDYNAQKLIPVNMHNAMHPVVSVNRMPGVERYPGTDTWVFGSATEASAFDTDSYMRDLTDNGEPLPSIVFTVAPKGHAPVVCR